MKRITSIFLSIFFSVLFTVLMPINVYAETNSSSCIINKYTIYLDDGSYYVTIISEVPSKSTKTGSKTTTHYGSSNNALWKVTVNGTFTYDGSSATCTSASHSVTVYENNWYIHSQNSYKTSNKAIADVTMKKKYLGIVTSTKDVHLVLACDKNGNLS